MTHPIAISHSLLDADALATAVAHAYGLAGPVTCTLVAPGVNDTYLITAGEQRFYYRVYRAGWRSPAEIRYELDLLLHLERAGIAVSVPLPRQDGAYVTEFAAPEGGRPAVLFTPAPGRVLEYVAEDGFQYGCTAARLHNAMDTFHSGLFRFRLDLDHLLEQPLAYIRPHAERVGSWEFFADLGARLRAQVRGVEHLLEQGICHGDLHGHNVHKAADGRLTLFDFDCGGPGYRAYDLAVYRWAVSRHARDRAPWDAFLQGYRTERAIGEADLAIIPAFVSIRMIWLMGLQAQWAKQKGTASVEMWLEGVECALRDWEAKRPDSDESSR